MLKDDTLGAGVDTASFHELLTASCFETYLDGWLSWDEDLAHT